MPRAAHRGNTTSIEADISSKRARKKMASVSLAVRCAISSRWSDGRGESTLSISDQIKGECTGRDGDLAETKTVTDSNDGEKWAFFKRDNVGPGPAWICSA
jgi:hypothetical protein